MRFDYQNGRFSRALPQVRKDATARFQHQHLADQVRVRQITDQSTAHRDYSDGEPPDIKQ